MDESGFPLKPKPEPVIAERGCKHPFVTSGNKTQITVLACVSAAGGTIPPLVILDQAVDLTDGEVPDTIYGLTYNGWSNAEIFDIWFNNQFLHLAPAVRPILSMDSHSSHFNPSTVHKAAKEKIILFCLPPHTTHLAQPLGKSVLKKCQDYMTRIPGRVISRFQFSTLFSASWYRAMTVKNIVAGFKVTGIYPFNPIAMSIQEDSDSAASLREATGVAFISLFTPPKKSRCRGQSSPELSSSLLSTSSPHLSPLSSSTSPSPSHDLNDCCICTS